MSISFPKIYPILDSSCIPAEDRSAFLRTLGEALASSGVKMLEYRNKTGSEAELRADTAILRAAMPAGKVKLILGDRADLVEEFGFDGAHLEQGDITPAEARRLLGPERIIGTSGGGDALSQRILEAPEANYYSVGAVFPTQTKQLTKPPIGVEGVRRLRALAGAGPVLSAVGGITRATTLEVLAAGADMVAVCGGIFRQPDPAAEFRRWMAALG